MQMGFGYFWGVVQGLFRYVMRASISAYAFFAVVFALFQCM